MALKKTVYTNDGYVAEYRRISEIRNPLIKNGATPARLNPPGFINVQVWKDEATRNLAKTDTKIVPAQEDKYKITTAIASIADGYEYLKTLEDFTNAINC